jgi:hypothetical protein
VISKVTSFEQFLLYLLCNNLISSCKIFILLLISFILFSDIIVFIITTLLSKNSQSNVEILESKVVMINTIISENKINDINNNIKILQEDIKLLHNK